jgi:glycosyltransferase involved in cell wall biosynthesis
VYVLATARIDNAVKGNGASLAEVVTRVARARAEARFVFLSWGADAERLRGEYQARGLGRQVLFLPPVGKVRLIDYYRSCDVVLDQLVYGYYGGTGLEAAAVGKPIVMRIRPEHYAPLYRGDVAPVENCRDAGEVEAALLRLIDAPQRRRAAGNSLREWLVRTHGRERTVPLLRGLLRLAADRIPLPADLDNPLTDPETEAEAAYHAACQRKGC